jgi:mannose-6-phosphate isomerase-like protein (cupin superfamily)
MKPWSTKRLPAQPDAFAPDGSVVRVLLALDGGSMAHFQLAPGQTSAAVAHRTVEEIWFVLSGRGEIWRKRGEVEEVTALDAGVCLTIPQGTRFQFRCLAGGQDAIEPLAVVAITMPPWPGEGEAYPIAGKWAAAVDLP